MGTLGLESNRGNEHATGDESAAVKASKADAFRAIGGKLFVAAPTSGRWRWRHDGLKLIGLSFDSEELAATAGLQAVAARLGEVAR